MPDETFVKPFAARRLSIKLRMRGSAAGSRGRPGPVVGCEAGDQSYVDGTSANRTPGPQYEVTSMMDACAAQPAHIAVMIPAARTSNHVSPGRIPEVMSRSSKAWTPSL